MGIAQLASKIGPAGFERLVVVKRLTFELLDDTEALDRFRSEARLAATIHHANVVATQHVGMDADGPYLVLEYVEGATLEELVDRSMLRTGAVAAPIALRIVLDVLSGLSAVHDARDSRGRSLQILHRDISLQNVLVGRDGVSRISDFGIAKSAWGNVQTAEGFLVGKLRYLPPEYLRREPVGPPMDVYALGVTLWAVLRGDLPWPEATDAQVMHAALDQGLPPLHDVAPALRSLVAKACARDPAERFTTARAMADSIRSLARETGWLGTHHEVAEWLEGLAGPDLEQRRERIASLRRERGTIRPVSGAMPARRAAWRWPLSVSVGLGATIALIFTFQREQEAAPPVSAAPAPLTLPPSNARPLQEEPATSHPSASAAAPSAREPAAKRAGPRLPVGTARSRPRGPAPAASPSPSIIPRLPDDIQVENPYGEE
jgi:serine/threonine-protein kinase